MLGIQSESVDPKTWSAVIKDFNFAGNTVEVLVVLSNNLNSTVPQTFNIDINDSNWKVNLQNSVRSFISTDDTKKQVKLDLVRGLVLDLSDPIVDTPPTDPNAQFIANVQLLIRATKAVNLGLSLKNVDVAALRVSVQAELDKDSTLVRYIPAF